MSHDYNTRTKKESVVSNECLQTLEANIIKACVCYFLSNFHFSPNDSPSKTMKNVFYFI